MKKNSVYLSGTNLDLSVYLEAARTQLIRMGFNVLSMATDVADEQKPLAHCLQDVRNCDIYVGVFAWRYGDILPGQTKSITELEYREAGEHGIDRLIFLLDSDFPWNPNLMDSRHGDGSRINNFRNELTTDKTVTFITSPETLASHLAAAIHRRQERVQKIYNDERLYHYKDKDSAGLSEYLSFSAHSDFASEIERTFTVLQCTVTDEKQFDRIQKTPETLPSSFRVIDNLMSQTIDPISQIQRVDQILDRYTRLIIIGEAGAGKTTTLKYLKIQAARKALIDANAPVPIFIDLAQWPESITDFPGLLIHEKQMQGIYTVPVNRLLLLLDGLNEISNEEYDRKLSAIENWIVKNPATPMILASRDWHYEKNKHIPVSSVIIQPLDNVSVDQFIRKYISADKVDDLLISLSTQQQNNINATISQFTRNPFQLRILCYLYEKQNEALSLSRTNLIRLFIHTLYQREQDMNCHYGISYESMLQAFGMLAAMIHKKSATSVHMGWAIKQFPKTIERQALITLGCQAGFIRLTKNDQFLQFSHQLLLEYFASEYLSKNITKCPYIIVDPVFVEGSRIRQPFDDVFCVLVELMEPEQLLSFVAARDPFLAAEILKTSGISETISKELLSSIVSSLTDAMKSSVTDKQVAAVAALANIGDSVLPFIKSLLEKGEFWVRRLAVKTLGKSNSMDALDLLIVALRDEHSWVRRDASDIITSWGKNFPELTQRYIVERLSGKDYNNRKEIIPRLTKCWVGSNKEITASLRQISFDLPAPKIDIAQATAIQELVNSDLPENDEMPFAGSRQVLRAPAFQDRRVPRVKKTIRNVNLDEISHSQHGHIYLRNLLAKDDLLLQERDWLVAASLKWMNRNMGHPYFHTVLKIVLDTCELSAEQICVITKLFTKRFEEVEPGVNRNRRFKIIHYIAQYNELINPLSKRNLVEAVFEWIITSDPNYIGSPDLLDSLRILALGSGISPVIEEKLKELTIRAQRFSAIKSLLKPMKEVPDSVNEFALRQVIEECEKMMKENGWLKELQGCTPIVLPLAFRLGDISLTMQASNLASTLVNLPSLSSTERVNIESAFYRRIGQGLWPKEDEAADILQSLGINGLYPIA